MRAGLNLLYLIPGVVGGTETYARGLVHALADVAQDTEFFVYVNGCAAEWPLPHAPNIRRIVCAVDGRNRALRYAYEQMVLPRHVRRHGLDVLHSLGYTTPAVARCAAVVTVHDLNFRSVPMRPHRRMALEVFVRLAVRRAERVITDSEFSRGEIVRSLRGRPDRTHVVYAAADAPPRPTEQARQGAGEYILAFGSGFAHKNMRGLLEAYGLAKHAGLKHRLVIVGRLAAEDASRIPAAYAGEIHVTGYVPPADLEGLLRGAALLVFPSRYEGFGLPILEAMHRGVPVVCSDRASIPEVAGDAALYFDPNDSDAMATAIRRVCDDASLAARLVARGREQAKRFDWRRSAIQVLEVYRKAIADRAGEGSARTVQSRRAVDGRLADLEANTPPLP